MSTDQKRVSPSILDVLVDEHGNHQRSQGIVPAGDEHDHHAHHGSEKAGGPVVVAEPGTPVGGLQNGLQRAGHVDKGIAHEEEPTEEGGREGGREEGKVVNTRLLSSQLYS